MIEFQEGMEKVLLRPDITVSFNPIFPVLTGKQDVMPVDQSARF